MLNTSEPAKELLTVIVRRAGRRGRIGEEMSSFHLHRTHFARDSHREGLETRRLFRLVGPTTSICWDTQVVETTHESNSAFGPVQLLDINHDRQSYAFRSGVRSLALSSQLVLQCHRTDTRSWVQRSILFFFFVFFTIVWIRVAVYTCIWRAMYVSWGSSDQIAEIKSSRNQSNISSRHGPGKNNFTFRTNRKSRHYSDSAINRSLNRRKITDIGKAWFSPWIVNLY